MSAPVVFVDPIDAQHGEWAASLDHLMCSWCGTALSPLLADLGRHVLCGRS